MVKNIKKKYSKPVIKKVKLSIDEVVLGGCKVTNGDTSGSQAASKYCGHPSCARSLAS